MRAKQNLKTFIIAFIRTFAITLMASIGVTSLWNLVFHGTGQVDWETSFRFAILLGIILPIAGRNNWAK